ncbi:uncharacterized protein LOC116351878 [Contarinia nasturtii]|uniref:uncharacterized protein LOC116351878 n=1 Tax=Contarinia nasturtii TaxID=265458 RepID=UPI0012D45B06|nr:uncharacterized protein LOC116351878 [Contarinia nasturtii]
MSVTNQVSNDYEIKGIQTIGEELYLSEKWADFHFEFESADGPCDRIPTHKSFLGTISDVFLSMFKDSWKVQDSVKIVDASMDEFKEFLQFFYLSRAKLTKENVAKVMYLADKYNVQECLRICEEFMTLLLSIDNVCWGYDLAILYNQEFLKKYCETMIAIDTKAVFSSDSFLKCSQVTMTNILQLDSLSCPELVVFEACMAWLKSVSHQDELTKEIVQQYLGDSFYKIRFATMTLQEFTSFDPSYEELFSFGEYRKIIKKLVSKSTTSKSEMEIQRKQFKPKFKILLCNRLVSFKYSNSPYFIKSKETTKFTVNKPFFLRGFQCDKLSMFVKGIYVDVKEKIPAKVAIVEISKLGDEESIVITQHVNMQTEESTKVCLDNPILVKPGVMYAIHMEMSPPKNACTGLLMKSEVKMDSDIIVQFPRDSTNDYDRAARGLIYKIAFNHI